MKREYNTTRGKVGAWRGRSVTPRGLRLSHTLDPRLQVQD